MLIVKEIPVDTKVKKALCPNCKKPLYHVGFMEGSKASGITTKCKLCGKVFVIQAT